MNYKLGALEFSLNVEGPLGPILAAEMESIAVSSTSRCDLAFVSRVNSKELVPPGAVLVKPVASWAGGYSVAEGGLQYTVEKSASKLSVGLELMPPTGRKYRYLPTSVARIVDWNYLSYPESVAKNFMYDVFDYLTQVVQLPLGQSYVHASAFQKGEEGVGIFAWGGIGKTTSMLKMVMEDGWKFLADDLAVLNSDGRLFRTPKRMQIYGYNLLGQARLKRAMLEGLPIMNRLAWEARSALVSPYKVRRRLSAEEIFGAGSVARSAQLTRAVFAERVNASTFEMVPMDREDLARRAAGIVMKEIEPFSQVLAALQGSGSRDVLPPFHSVLEDTRRCVLQGIRNAEPYHWRIPLQATPEQIFAHLKQHTDAWHRAPVAA